MLYLIASKNGANLEIFFSIIPFIRLQFIVVLSVYIKYSEKWNRKHCIQNSYVEWLDMRQSFLEGIQEFFKAF